MRDHPDHPPLLSRLLDDAPEHVVFGITPEREAAQCNLAARLAHQGRIEDVLDHRYAFSLGLAVPGPGTAYAHYFQGPVGDDGAAPLVPVVTVHTPGADDLGGLIRLAP